MTALKIHWISYRLHCTSSNWFASTLYTRLQLPKITKFTTYQLKLDESRSWKCSCKSLVWCKQHCYQMTKWAIVSLHTGRYTNSSKIKVQTHTEKTLDSSSKIGAKIFDIIFWTLPTGDAVYYFCFLNSTITVCHYDRVVCGPAFSAVPLPHRQCVCSSFSDSHCCSRTVVSLVSVFALYGCAVQPMFLPYDFSLSFQTCLDAWRHRQIVDSQWLKCFMVLVSSITWIWIQVIHWLVFVFGSPHPLWTLSSACSVCVCVLQRCGLCEFRNHHSSLSLSAAQIFADGIFTKWMFTKCGEFQSNRIMDDWSPIHDRLPRVASGHHEVPSGSQFTSTTTTTTRSSPPLSPLSSPPVNPTLAQTKMPRIFIATFVILLLIAALAQPSSARQGKVFEVLSGLPACVCVGWTQYWTLGDVKVVVGEIFEFEWIL